VNALPDYLQKVDINKGTMPRNKDKSSRDTTWELSLVLLLVATHCTLAVSAPQDTKFLEVGKEHLGICAVARRPTLSPPLRFVNILFEPATEGPQLGRRIWLYFLLRILAP